MANRPKLPDLIDFFIIKGLSNNYINAEENDNLSSDHSPVILTVSETIILKEYPPKLASKKTDWEKFREKLEASIQMQAPLETKEQIEQEVEQLITDIQKATRESTSPIQRNSSYIINYSIEVKELVSAKRRARRKWQQTRYLGDKTIANRLSNARKKLIREIKNKHK